MGVFRTVSDINSDFSRNLHTKNPTPVYFAPPLTGFPLQLGTGARIQRTRMMELPDDQSFKIGLGV